VSVGSSASPQQTSAAWLRALALTAPIVRQPERIFPLVIQEYAQRFNAAPALIFGDQCMTYAELAERANQYSSWAVQQGLIGGTVLALLMSNCAEYVAIWLGITRVGGVVALINDSLTGHALAHSLDIVAATHVIVSQVRLDAFLGVSERLRIRPRCWVQDRGNEPPRSGICDIELAPAAATALQAANYRAPSIRDRALYIYTSGSSGLPKAVNISHYRIMQWTHWFAGLMDTRPDDRLYNCLPMYHSIGGVVAVGAPLIHGGAVVIRQRFSASQFWTDIARWDCTLFQYIGELCRYLVNSPAQVHERDHHLRLCCGNGLRPAIWLRFKQRFAIPHILEYYASTEGNVSLFNVEEKFGAVGRVPAVLRHRHSIALIRYDEENAEPVRDAQGRYCRCADNEIGEAIGELRQESSNPSTGFEGYTDPVASERKILRDVFAKGDQWYRTGDLMRRDVAGFFYFVDRIGDTYRWKGENISTSEVAECLRTFEGVKDAVVFGVKVPGTEGRAGMAVIAASSAIDLASLRRHIGTELTAAARPLFLRIVGEIPATETYKYRKSVLMQIGYDPAATDEPILFDDRDAQAYVVVNEALLARVQSGHVRL